jgi:chromosome segregation ATPase
MDAAFEATFEDQTRWHTVKEDEDLQAELVRAKAMSMTVQKECIDLRAQMQPRNNDCTQLKERADQLQQTVDRLRAERDHLRGLVKQVRYSGWLP